MFQFSPCMWITDFFLDLCRESLHLLVAHCEFYSKMVLVILNGLFWIKAKLFSYFIDVLRLSCNILEICYSGLCNFELNLLVLAINFVLELKIIDIISLHIRLNFLEDFITLYCLVIPLHLWESAQRTRKAPN